MPSAPIWRSEARRSGPTSCAAAAGRHRRRACSPRCGISCGPARSRTTRSRRCGRCCRGSRSGTAADGRTSSPGSAHAPRATRRRRSVVPRVAAARARPTPTEAAHASALQLLERHGVAHPRGRARRGRRGRVRRRVPRAEGARGARAGCGAATSLPGWARPSSRCRAPSTACGPSVRPERSAEGRGARGHRPRAGVRRIAPVARVVGPPGPRAPALDGGARRRARCSRTWTGVDARCSPSRARLATICGLTPSPAS